jgi:hypothetical protein
MPLLLAKALKALRKGVDALIKWNDRNDSWFRLFADCDEVKNIKFQYVLKLLPDKPLFKVNLNSGQIYSKLPERTILRCIYGAPHAVSLLL